MSNNAPDYKDNLFFDKAKDSECCVKLEHVKFEQLINGIFYARQKLDRAMTTHNYRVYDHISEAIDSLNVILKQIS